MAAEATTTQRPQAVAAAHLQRKSDGVIFDSSATDWRYCYYSENLVEGRDEKYMFPCANHLECCGNECCEPVPTLLPFWLWLLLALLLLLLLLICCSLCAYIWYKCRPRKGGVQKKRVKRIVDASTYRSLGDGDGTLDSKGGRQVVIDAHGDTASVSTMSNEDDIRLARLRALRVIEMERQAHRDRRNKALAASTSRLLDQVMDDDHVTVEASDSASNVAANYPTYSGYRQTQMVEETGEIVEEIDENNDIHNISEQHNRKKQNTNEKFIPSPMEEVYIKKPQAITVQRRTEDDISREQHPLIVPHETPELSRAQTAYYRSGQPQVPSYNL